MTPRWAAWPRRVVLAGLVLVLAAVPMSSTAAPVVPGAATSGTGTAHRSAAGAPVPASALLAGRPATMIVEGRTKRRSAVVRIRGWKPTQQKWVLLKKVRSTRHQFRTTVSLRGVGNRPLRIKPAGQKVRKVRTPSSGGMKPVEISLPPCGGFRPKKSDGSLWTCSFSDEFEGAELDRSKWMPQTHGFESGDATNFACYKDTPETVSVGNGVLRLRLFKGAAEPCAGRNGRVTPFSAGSVSTYRLFSQRYGRFEARTKNTAADVTGLHEAFWLWPDDREVDVTRWPASGEIDIAETYSQHPDLAIPFLHTALDLESLTLLLIQALNVPLLHNILSAGLVPWDLVQAAISNTAWNCEAKRGVWNTYAVEWGPRKIEIFVNGKLCLRNTSGDPAFKKPYIIAFTQLLGGGANKYTSKTPLPATYEVDYVRVWR